MTDCIVFTSRVTGDMCNTVWSFQMEDDVEVELELEKQLALAHELFPT